MKRTRVSKKESKNNLCNAVRYIWAAKKLGQKPKISDTLSDYNVSRSYSSIVGTITGHESDLNALCEEIYQRTRKQDAEKNERAKARAESAGRQADLFNAVKPCLQIAGQSQKDFDIERIRYEIRTEILKENADRDKLQKARRFDNIATECLYKLVFNNPEWSAEKLASKAVEIAEKFTQLLDKE